MSTPRVTQPAHPIFDSRSNYMTSNEDLGSGCLTCRLRRKKCKPEGAASSPCVTCERLAIECMGYSRKRPQWMQDPKNVENCKANMKKWIRDRNCGNTQGTLSLSRFYGTEYPVFLKMESASPSLSMDSGQSYSGHTISTSTLQPSAVSADRNSMSLRKAGMESQLFSVHGQTHRLALKTPSTVQSAFTKSSSLGVPSSTRSLDTSTPPIQVNRAKEVMSNDYQSVHNSSHPFPPQSLPGGHPHYSSGLMTSTLPTATGHHPHCFYSQPEPSSAHDASVNQLWNPPSDDSSRTLLVSISGGALRTAPQAATHHMLSSSTLGGTFGNYSFASDTAHGDQAFPANQEPPLSCGTLAPHVPLPASYQDLGVFEPNDSFSPPTDSIFRTQWKWTA